MLPRPRILSILLLGLGTVLLAAGILLPKVLNVDPKMLFGLPSVSYTLWAEDGVSTRINEEGKWEEVHSPLQRQLHDVLIKPADADKTSLCVGVTETCEFPPEIMGTDPLTGLVEANAWIVTIGRLTGEALAPTTLVDRMADVPRPVDFEGNWVKLPVDTEEKEYLVFDDFLHDSLPTKFAGEEERGGNRTLHFRQDIKEMNLAQKYRSYASQLTQDDKSGFLQYQGIRDLRAEPKPDPVIDMAEDIHLWWGIRDGEPIMDYLRFNGKMDEGFSNQLLFGAIQNFQHPTLEPRSIGLIMSGSILVLIAIVGTVRSPARRKAE